MSRKNATVAKGPKSAPLPAALRVAGHRSRQAVFGRKRVEVVVPTRDVPLIKQLAERLRAAPTEASAVRKAVATAVAPTVARTGKELVALLRSSPLGGVTLDLKRDRSPPREIDLGP
jgi:hypothetical protein